MPKGETASAAQVVRAPEFSLSFSDRDIFVNVSASSFDDLFERVARANEQFAKLMASRNAISLAATSSPTADSTGGSEGRPADNDAAESAEEVGQPGEVDHGELDAGKDGNGDEGAASQSAAPEVTYDQVREAVLKLSATKGRDAAIGVLDTFGVGNAKELTEDQWAEAVAALTEALAA